MIRHKSNISIDHKFTCIVTLHTIIKYKVEVFDKSKEEEKEGILEGKTESIKSKKKSTEAY